MIIPVIILKWIQRKTGRVWCGEEAEEWYASASAREKSWRNMADTRSMTNFYWWDVLQVSLSPDFLFVLVFLFPNTVSLLTRHIYNSISSFWNTLLLKASSMQMSLNLNQEHRSWKQNSMGLSKLNFECSGTFGLVWH